MISSSDLDRHYEDLQGENPLMDDQKQRAPSRQHGSPIVTRDLNKFQPNGSGFTTSRIGSKPLTTHSPTIQSRPLSPITVDTGLEGINTYKSSSGTSQHLSYLKTIPDTHSLDRFTGGNGFRESKYDKFDRTPPSKVHVNHDSDSWNGPSPTSAALPHPNNSNDRESVRQRGRELVKEIREIKNLIQKDVQSIASWNSPGMDLSSRKQRSRSPMNRSYASVDHADISRKLFHSNVEDYGRRSGGRSRSPPHPSDFRGRGSATIDSKVRAHRSRSADRSRRLQTKSSYDYDYDNSRTVGGSRSPGRGGSSRGRDDFRHRATRSRSVDRSQLREYSDPRSGRGRSPRDDGRSSYDRGEFSSKSARSRSIERSQFHNPSNGVQSTISGLTKSDFIISEHNHPNIYRGVPRTIDRKNSNSSMHSEGSLYMYNSPVKRVGGGVSAAGSPHDYPDIVSPPSRTYSHTDDPNMNRMPQRPMVTEFNPRPDPTLLPQSKSPAYPNQRPPQNHSGAPPPRSSMQNTQPVYHHNGRSGPIQNSPGRVRDPSQPVHNKPIRPGGPMQNSPRPSQNALRPLPNGGRNMVNPQPMHPNARHQGPIPNGPMPMPNPSPSSQPYPMSGRPAPPHPQQSPQVPRIMPLPQPAPQPRSMPPPPRPSPGPRPMPPHQSPYNNNVRPGHPMVHRPQGPPGRPMRAGPPPPTPGRPNHAPPPRPRGPNYMAQASNVHPPQRFSMPSPVNSKPPPVEHLQVPIDSPSTIGSFTTKLNETTIGDDTSYVSEDSEDEGSSFERNGRRRKNKLPKFYREGPCWLRTLMNCSSCLCIISLLLISGLGIYWAARGEISLFGLFADRTAPPTFSPAPTSSNPTRSPTNRPTPRPTPSPTPFPTSTASAIPSNKPSLPVPSSVPSTSFPSPVPSTSFPSLSPSTSPPTLFPSMFKSNRPSSGPTSTMPTQSPSYKPSVSLSPTRTPPTSRPTVGDSVTFFITGGFYSRADLFYEFGTAPVDIEFQRMRQEESSFLIHLGNFNDPQITNCAEPSFSTLEEVFTRGSPVPVFAVNGADDYINCPNPFQAFTYWNQYYSSIERNWNLNGFSVERMDEHVENFAFVQKRVLFIGIDVVMGDVNTITNRGEREFFNFQWIQDQVAEKFNFIDDLVIFGNGETRGENWNNQNAHANFFRRVIEDVIDYAMIRTLYVHPSSSNSWEVSKPFDSQFFTVVNVLESHFPFMKITVDPDGRITYFYDQPS